MAANDTRAGLVEMDLSEEQVAQRAEKLAQEELDKSALEERKTNSNREWNASLRGYEERIAVLAVEVKTHKAWVPAQHDLFEEELTDEVVPDDEPTPKRSRRGRRAAAEATDAA